MIIPLTYIGCILLAIFAAAFVSACMDDLLPDDPTPVYSKKKSKNYNEYDKILCTLKNELIELNKKKLELAKRIEAEKQIEEAKRVIAEAKRVEEENAIRNSDEFKEAERIRLGKLSAANHYREMVKENIQLDV